MTQLCHITRPLVNTTQKLLHFLTRKHRYRTTPDTPYRRPNDRPLYDRLINIHMSSLCHIPRPLQPIPNPIPLPPLRHRLHHNLRQPRRVQQMERLI